MDAAFTLFVSEGLAGASMERIAKAAGASTKTLYSRFNNKSELLEAVVRRNVDRVIVERVRAFAQNPLAVGPREFLYKLGMQISGAIDEETVGLIRVTFAEAHRFPVLRKMYEEVTNRGKGAIARALEMYREDGLIEFEGDALLQATLCFAMITDTARIRAVIGDIMGRAELETYVAAGVDLFLRSCTPKAKPPRKPRPTKDG